jgi:AbrB family looped-hinge helix DNA binding protein
MKIGERGQVTIPQQFRKHFGLKPATEVEFVTVKGMLVLKKADPARRKAWAKSYGTLKSGSVRTDDLMQELRDR